MPEEFVRVFAASRAARCSLDRSQPGAAQGSACSASDRLQKPDGPVDWVFARWTWYSPQRQQLGLRQLQPMYLTRPYFVVVSQPGGDRSLQIPESTPAVALHEAVTLRSHFRQDEELVQERKR